MPVWIDHWSVVSVGRNVMRTRIEQILIDRDQCTPEEAAELLRVARQHVREGIDPEEVLEDEFGLEPDFIEDLL